MNLLKRVLSTTLAMTLFASVLAVQPAAAKSKDAGVDSVAEVEEAVEDVLDSTPVEDLVEETAAEVVDLDIDETAEVVVELETDDGSSVEIPADANDAVVLQDDDGEEIEIELPGNGDDAEVTDDGSAVYEDALPDTDVVVQAQDNGGVRMITVIDGPDAPDSFRFPVESEALTLVLTEDGGAAFFNEEWAVDSLVAAPWAYDAEGNEVSSWYTIEDNTLVLNVEHSAATAYPVVADPCWKCWLGAAGGAVLSFAAAGALCAGTGGLACAAALYAAGSITAGIYQTIKQQHAKPLLCKISYLPLNAYPSGKVVKFIKRVILGGNLYKKWKICN